MIDGSASQRLSASPAPGDGPADWLLVRNGILVDGTGAPAQEAMSVLVVDGRIRAVGGTEDIDDRLPPGRGDVIDALGSTIMPGLIDVHCHMTYGQARSEEEIDLYTSHEMRTLIAAHNLRLLARGGVTSISQPGGSFNIGVGLRDAVNSGLIEGPRMTTAGRYLSTSNSLTDWYPDEVGVPESSIGVLTNTPDAMVDEIRRQVKAGVDYIKIADSPSGAFQAFSDTDMGIIADAAHQLGRPVTIHARGDAEVRGAVRAGFDWIMHGNTMSDPTIEALAAAGTTLVPTLVFLANLADWGHLCGVPRHDIESAKRMMDRSGRTLHKAHEAGVRFALGTDSGFAVTPYGEWHGREAELLHEYAGLSPVEAVRAATANGAPMLNLQGQVGELAEGMLADVIVVRGNVAADIGLLSNRQNISAVVRRGERVVIEGVESFHHDRAMTISTSELTWDLVREAELASRTATSPWPPPRAAEAIGSTGRNGVDATPYDRAPE
jgi:imidazolonepropionase-like amidohydrolase